METPNEMRERLNQTMTLEGLKIFKDVVPSVTGLEKSKDEILDKLVEYQTWFYNIKNGIPNNGKAPF